MKLSERARKILRKIFAVGYQSICAYGGSYHSLGDFKIDNDGAAFFLENKFIQEASGEDVQAPIRVALNIVDLFWHVAPGKQDPPIEVKNFRELCSLALKKTDEMSIRYFS
ncbi:unnamed protein product [Cuscuta campestris]|uniref:Uncharacterized protein n=1 Tax=Cuscuta campestris TaxID=132261 RepID=A0A484LQ70_9ASTE|nr:unnamed protein product [Cuscuta campestris]